MKFKIKTSVGGEEEFALVGFRGLHDAEAVVDAIRFDQRLAYAMSLGREKGVCHCASNGENICAF